uniref:Uncharacterized protein n=1 Tax=Setaria italica TaxID=4555 RepID=K3ZYW8_SETIT
MYIPKLEGIVVHPFSGNFLKIQNIHTFFRKKFQLQLNHNIPEVKISHILGYIYMCHTRF